MAVDDAHRASERAARESYGRLIALRAARTRDVAGAEDALGDAFAAALRTWPVDGVPDNPDAWLLIAARRRQTDAIRKCQVRTAAEEHVKLMLTRSKRWGAGGILAYWRVAGDGRSVLENPWPRSRRRSGSQEDDGTHRESVTPRRSVEACLYSLRSATIGSMVVARRAGT